MTNNNECTDFELISLYKSAENNDKALTELILRYKGTVIGIASGYTGFPMELDDLIQEGMIGLFAAINSYCADKQASFATYAKVCIHNSIKSALKKLTRLKNVPPEALVSLEDAEESAIFDCQSAEDVFIDSQYTSEFFRIMYEELSKFENDVIRLYLLGCSYNEIAQRLDKTPKAIDNAIQRIRKKLQGVTF